jgi:hypothetical protein
MDPLQYNGRRTTRAGSPTRTQGWRGIVTNRLVTLGRWGRLRPNDAGLLHLHYYPGAFEESLRYRNTSSATSSHHAILYVALLIVAIV